MDSISLAIANAVTVLSLGFMIGLLAFLRRERHLWLYAAGFLLATLSMGLFAARQLLPAWLGVAVPGGLLPLVYLLLAAGVRSDRSRGRPWPWRYSLYAVLWLGALTGLFLLGVPFAYRAMLCSTLVILATAEFILANSPRTAEKGTWDQTAAWVIGLSFMILHLVRIAWLFLDPADPGGAEHPTHLFALIFTQVYFIFFAGLILLSDGAQVMHLLELKNRELSDQAVIDELTGLFNRRQLDHNLEAEMERAKRYNQAISLIMLDLDHFKQVNDTWGHQTGDEVLCGTAHAIRALIREPDHLYRWGGEEFIILAPHTKLEGASVMAEKVRLAVAELRHANAGMVTASFGVAEWRMQESRELWFRQVDQALYQAKNRGRNRVVCYDPNLQPLPKALIQLDWQAEWESGNQSIDADHRRLVSLAKHLIDQSLAGSPSSYLLERYDELLEHLKTHFTNEEAIIHRVQYPGAHAHSQLHHALLTEALTLRQRLVEQGAATADFFGFLVGKVVMDHLLQADVLFFPFTKAKG